MIKDILKEIVGASPLPSASSKSLQAILNPSPVKSPARKKQKRILTKAARKFLDLEVSQSSGASADEEEGSDSEEDRISNLFASQKHSSSSQGDYLALHFQHQLEDVFQPPKKKMLPRSFVARTPLKRTMSTPARTPASPCKTEKPKVKTLREFRNRRISLSEPESPLPTATLRKPIKNMKSLQDRIPKKYRLSLESPFEDFKLVSPKTSLCRQKFTFVGKAEEKPNTLALPPMKPLRPLAYVIKK